MAKKKKTAPEGETFVYDKKQYKVIMGSVNIPGIGIRTAAEILVDEESQKYLVENGCVGSVIEEYFGEEEGEAITPPAE